MLNGVVAASSFLNALSHGAVVLGALDAAYVLSILVGVGFDAITMVLRGSTGGCMSASLRDHIFFERRGTTQGEDIDDIDYPHQVVSTICIQALLAVSLDYHWKGHMKALLIYRSS